MENIKSKKVSECVKTYIDDVKKGNANDPNVIAYVQFGLSEDLKFISAYTYGSDENIVKFLLYLKNEYIDSILDRIQEKTDDTKIDFNEVQ